MPILNVKIKICKNSLSEVYYLIMLSFGFRIFSVFHTQSIQILVHLNMNYTIEVLNFYLLLLRKNLVICHY